jgi:hypothetical protein
LQFLTNSWVIGDNQKQLIRFLSTLSTPDEVFEEYSNYAGLTILYSSDYVSLQKLIETYFNKYPPFSKKKKDEFPDAIVLLTLETWAEKENTVLLAVSKDRDWHEFCKGSQHLLCVDDLFQALTLLHNDSEFVLRAIVEAIKSDSIDEVCGGSLFTLLENQIHLIDIVTDTDGVIDCQVEDSYADLTDITDFDEQLLEVIDVNENEIFVQGYVTCTINAIVSVHFYFPENTNAGTSTFEQEESVEFKVIFSFEKCNDGDIKFKNVELVADTVSINFDTFEPDWMHEEME